MRRLLFVISIAAIAALVTVPSFAGAASPSTWKVYNYNSSGQSLSPTPATSTAASNATFNFQQNVYTAQLLTSAKELTGNLTGGTVNATLTVSGVNGTFVDQNGGGCTPDSQTVRLFFKAPPVLGAHPRSVRSACRSAAAVSSRTASRQPTGAAPSRSPTSPTNSDRASSRGHRLLARGEGEGNGSVPVRGSRGTLVVNQLIWGFRSRRRTSRRLSGCYRSRPRSGRSTFAAAVRVPGGFYA